MTDEEFEAIKIEILGEPVKKVRQKRDKRFTEKSNHPTPSGGDYSVAYYYDAKGNPCVKEKAIFVNVIEYKKGNIRINEHYASLAKS